jgi:signal transduction histidine kinase
VSVRGWVRGAAGLGLGVVTAGVELAFLAVAAIGCAYAFAFSKGRQTVPQAVEAGAFRLTELERRRLERYYGSVNSADYGLLRALAFLVLRAPLGMLGGLILFLIALGAEGVFGLVYAWANGREYDGMAFSGWIALYLGVAAAVLLFLAVQGLVGVVFLERRLALRCLGPNSLAAYERRIAELAVTRAEVVDAVNDERRRIERDLHDGVQQRLVGLAMLIGRARRAADPERTQELMGQAHAEAQAALNDLREVTWRVYPAALDAEGLAVALETVAERSALPVEISFAVSRRLARRVETVAYFVVTEAVTNAAKHAGASRVSVGLSLAGAGQDTMLVVRIEDDGKGGADPAGGGLAGLARRAAALDGRLTVHSPPGGPTVVTAELPCG